MKRAFSGYPSELIAPPERFAGGALVAAAALGVLGDLIFRQGGLGLNLLLWSSGALVAVLCVSRFAAVRIDPRRLALLVSALVVSLSVTWRASEWLHVGSLSAAVTLVSMAVALPPGTGLRRTGFSAFAFAAGLGCVACVAGPLRLLPHGANSRLIRRLSGEVEWVLRGAFIAIALVVVFGGLFVAADAVLQRLMTRVLHLDLHEAWVNAGWTLVCAWGALGLLWGVLAFEPVEAPAFSLPEPRRLKAGELAMILGVLVLLFAVFVAIQARYLFGGHSLVRHTTGLTYAEYARRGFFELVVATALLLPVLLAMDWGRVQSAGSARAYRIGSACLVALLVVVVASALQRLRAYEDTYGLTELRFYALTLLAAVALAFVWFSVTVIRGLPGSFVSGCLGIALTCVLGLQVVNPDGIIAGVNLDRAEEGNPFDARYLSGLSADAVPAVVANFRSVPAQDRCAVANDLMQRWGHGSGDWTTWSLARARAVHAVSSHSQDLAAACGSAVGHSMEP